MRRVAFIAVVIGMFGCEQAIEISPAPKLTGSAAASQTQVGLASYYWSGLHGRKTASGVRYDMNSLVAAHPTYAFGTMVRVTNLENGRMVRVRIVDRGPVRRIRRQGVVIDLSRAAARALGMIRDGRTRVRLEVERLGKDRR